MRLPLPRLLSWPWPRPVVLAVLMLCMVLTLPTAVTGAYWTTRHDAAATTAGTGRWCSVPNHQLQSNVYPLTTFPTVSLDTGGTVRMLAVPVINNGSYGPATNTSTVKVRLWGCNAQALSTTPTLKVTAWRKASTATTDPLVWNAAATSPLSPGYAATLPAQRLNLTTGWGKKLQDLHRLGSNDGTSVSGTLRTQYSWVIGHGRTKTNPTADANCTGTLLSSCVINTNGYPRWADAFRADPGTAGNYLNSVTYTARKFWTGTGTWPTNVQPSDLQLDRYTPALGLPYNTGSTSVTNNQLSPTSTSTTAEPTGRQVEWVVMEWWGTTPTSYGDLAIEVLLE